MGKKGDKKRAFDHNEEDELIIDNPELQAEINALKAMRAEQRGENTENLATAKTTYNKEALMQCVEELGTTSLPFYESMQIGTYDVGVHNENDDLEREMAFYNHSLLAVALARSRFQELGVPFERPNDYFCESVKSDAHMSRIKDKLILEEKRISAFEQRKQRDMNKKYNKQLSALRTEEKIQSSKSTIEAVTNIRKSIGKNKDKSNPISTEEKVNKILNDRPGKSKKRMIMDKKYGHGGKEAKKSRLSDSKSLNDLSDYNPRGGKAVRRMKPMPKVGSGKGFKRGGAPGAGREGKKRAGKQARLERRASARSA